MYTATQKVIDLGDGRQIEIETGKLAKQADGSVVVKQGNTMLLATVVAAKDAKEGTDFMPLQVEYKEKYASAGRFPGGFLKREARPLRLRNIGLSSDRPRIASAFPVGLSCGCVRHRQPHIGRSRHPARRIGRSGGIGGVGRIGHTFRRSHIGGACRTCRRRIEDQPRFSEMERADIDIMVGATYDNILMVEGEMKEVSEADMLEAIKFAHEAIKKQCLAQMELSRELGKDVKRTYCHEVNDEELKAKVIADTYDKVYAIARDGSSKHERSDKFDAVEEEFLSQYGEEERAEKRASRKEIFPRFRPQKAMRNMILDEGIRLDGRATDQIRPIWCEVGYLPSAHGSAIFTAARPSRSPR